jgi:hypothetical protein
MPIHTGTKCCMMLLQGQGHRVHKCCLKTVIFHIFPIYCQVFESGDLTYIWYIGLTKPFILIPIWLTFFEVKVTVVAHSWILHILWNVLDLGLPASPWTSCWQRPFTDRAGGGSLLRHPSCQSPGRPDRSREWVSESGLWNSFKLYNYVGHMLYFLNEQHLFTYLQGRGHFDPSEIIPKQVSKPLW